MRVLLPLGGQVAFLKLMITLTWDNLFEFNFLSTVIPLWKHVQKDFPLIHGYLDLQFRSKFTTYQTCQETL